MIAGKIKKPEEISGTVTRVLGPMEENGYNVRKFVVDDSAKVYRVYDNGNTAASDGIAFMVEKGDKVKFTCHENSRAVKTMTIEGFKGDK
jgi:hypothetical protein